MRRHNFVFLILMSGALLWAGLLLTACDSSTPELPAPERLDATGADGAVRLSWEAIDAFGADGYHLYRDTAEIATADAGLRLGEERQPDTLLVDTTVTNGTIYYYRVAAVSENGRESPLSPEVRVTPFPQPTRP